MVIKAKKDQGLSLGPEVSYGRNTGIFFAAIESEIEFFAVFSSPRDGRLWITAGATPERQFVSLVY